MKFIIFSINANILSSEFAMSILIINNNYFFFNKFFLKKIL